jgi:uncharacterized RDD family membrane protein YckC/predicted Ser/Thr protein kinase
VGRVSSEDDEDGGIAEGTALAHYVVGRRVGAGAMGTVYEAHDTALDRTVAVKVIRGALAGDAGVADRFTREARSAARANHANLTHIYFVGTAAGRAFYAMEYVPGENLEARIARAGPLDLGQAVAVLVEAARGLEAAHAVGVVHRDVKPSNLILATDGRVKVTDFGLAKSLRGDASATQAGTVIGTPTYMSPEQCRGADVDARSDVYALGLTAWYVLAGRAPFAGDSVGEVIADQMRTPLPSIAAVRADLPTSVDAVLSALCAKEPAKRPGSMAAVVALLEGIRPRAVRPALFATRAAALAIDMLVFSVVMSALAFGAQGVLAWAGPRGEEAVQWISGAVVLAVALALQWGMEWRYAATFGKQLVGIRVVREDGLRASVRALLGRFALIWPVAPALALPDRIVQIPRVHFVLAIVQLVTMLAGAAAWPFAKRRTLSDILTRTRVVYSEATPDATTRTPGPRPAPRVTPPPTSAAR